MGGGGRRRREGGCCSRRVSRFARRGSKGVGGMFLVASCLIGLLVGSLDWLVSNLVDWLVGLLTFGWLEVGWFVE